MTDKSVAESRQAFTEKMGAQNMAPLWNVLGDLVKPLPVSRCLPAIWRYEDVRPTIMESGGIITAKEAERRVLILENPALRGESKITNSLYAGLQLILPGEVAPAHRHAQSALRFIVEGEKGYTAVDGERTYMHKGDFIITPSWTWHDHGNEGDEPVVWLDGLDIPIVGLFEATFMEHYNSDEQPTSRQPGDALARYGSGLLPVDYDDRPHNSPVFNYPYDRTREALETMRKQDEWDPCHGLKLRYVNPATGEAAMPGIGTFMQLLPKGFETSAYQATDGTVFSVVEGTGSITIGEEKFDWTTSDTFVVPPWMPYRFETKEESVVFSFSDQPIQKKLGIWRENRGNN